MTHPKAPHGSAILTLVAGQDIFSKQLMLIVAPAVVIWARYTLQLLLVGTTIWRKRSPTLWRTQQWRWHALRGCTVVSGSVFGYAALQRIPVAEFTAIYCLVPLCVTLVARFALKEKVSMLGWLCLAGGLTGALLVARPGGQVDAIGAGLALLGVGCYSGFQILTGYLARQDSPLTIQFLTSLFGFVVMTAVLPFFWPTAWTWSGLALLLFVALAGSYGQYFNVLAFSKAPASVLTPYLYTALIFSTFGGWLVFHHLPDFWAMLGMLLIAVFGMVSVVFAPAQHRS